MRQTKCWHTLSEMLIVVLAIGLLMGVLFPKMEYITKLQMNKVRVNNINQIANNFNSLLEKDNIKEKINKLSDIKCLWKNELNKINKILWKKIINTKKDLEPLKEYINYWTMIWWCKWKPWFIVDTKNKRIWLIVNLEDSNKGANPILVGGYYNINPKELKSWNIFNKYNWDFSKFRTKNGEGNVYIRIINRWRYFK